MINNNSTSETTKESRTQEHAADVAYLKSQQISQINPKQMWADMSTKPVITGLNHMPLSKLMQSNVATNDDAHADIKVTEEHIYQGDYHIILENSEATDKTKNVQSEFGLPPLAPPFDQWLSSRKSHSDIMMAFKSWSEPSTIICNLCLQECDRGKPFQNHLGEVIISLLLS